MRQPIKLAIFLAQISQIGCHGHPTSGRPGDDHLRRKRAAVPIDVVGELAVQCAELSAPNLAQMWGCAFIAAAKNCALRIFPTV